MITAGDRIDFISTQCIVPHTGDLMILETFQTDFIEDTYQSGIIVSGLSCPRGQGKSGLLAAMALSEVFLNTDSPDVNVFATRKAQAKRPSGVYGVAVKMRNKNPELAAISKVNRGNDNPHLSVPGNDGQIAPLAIEDVDAALGLSPSLAICDEFGSDFWTDERWAAVVQAAGKRGADGCKVVGLSTPNSVHSAMYTLRQAVIDGTIDPYTAWTEYAAPEDADPMDEAVWYGCNPALGRFLDISALRMDATSRPLWLFKMMRLGQWIDHTSDDSWLGSEGARHWDEGNLSGEEMEPRPDDVVVIGADKSAWNDASAWVALWRRGETWFAKAHIYYPTGSITNPAIDHAKFKNDIRAFCAAHNVVCVGYDDRYFVEGAQELESEGLPMLQIPQNINTLGPAYSLFHEVITSGNFRHEVDAAYRQHVLGAVPRLGSNGAFMLGKNPKTKTKIDAAVATGIAFSAMMNVVPLVKYDFLLL